MEVLKINQSINLFFIVGHYIPTWSAEIVKQQQQQSNKDLKFNFGGFLLGNAYTNIYSG